MARLERLLALVPYLLAHPGVAVEQVARDFGVSQASLLDDLQLLFVCGLPGHLPDDLIDVSVDGGVIHLSNADTIARPLRLRPDEALALLMGLKVLTSTPGGVAGDSADSVVATVMGKLSQAAGLTPTTETAAQALTVVRDSQTPTLEKVQEAMRLQRQLCIEYHSPRRDSITMRHIDPLSVEVVEGRYYVQAWCHEAGELRVFRTDRMMEASLSQRPRQVPDNAHPQRLPRTVFASSSEDVEVTLRIGPQAQWMIDYYDATVLEREGSTPVKISLRTPDTAWVVRLALRMGEQAVIVSPAQVVQQVREDALAGRQASVAAG